MITCSGSYSVAVLFTCTRPLHLSITQDPSALRGFLQDTTISTPVVLPPQKQSHLLDLQQAHASGYPLAT
jgi:hypothetical protein